MAEFGGPSHILLDLCTSSEASEADCADKMYAEIDSDGADAELAPETSPIPSLRSSRQTTPRTARKQPQLPPCIPHRTQRNKDGTPVMLPGYRWCKYRWRVRARVQGKPTYLGVHVNEADACTAAINTFRQHGPPDLQAYLREAPQPPGSVQAAAAAHSESQSANPSLVLDEASPLLQPFLQATRDPRIAASIIAGSSPAAAQPQQQQQQQQQRCPENLQSDAPAQPSASTLRSTARLFGKTILDGRYRLPCRLRKNAGSKWTRGYRARRVQASPPVFSYEIDLRDLVDDSKKRFGQVLCPGGRIRVEADAAELAIKHYRAMGLEHVRSLEEAEQDPRWQQELQQLCSAGHGSALPAPAPPQADRQYAEHALQGKAERRADHGPQLPKPNKRKAPASQPQQPFSSPLDMAQPHASPKLSPVQPPKKPNRAPFAAATCLPVVRNAFSEPTLPEDDLMQYHGESAFQAVDAPEQVQPLLTDQLPVQIQLEVPLVTPEVPCMSPQLPTESVAPAGSFQAETTAVPKLKEPSISAQPSADQALAVVPYAGPSSCAARHKLEALIEQQRGTLHTFSARTGPPAQELKEHFRTLLDIAGVLIPGQDLQLLAEALVRQQFPLYSAAEHAALAAFMTAAVHQIVGQPLSDSAPMS